MIRVASGSRDKLYVEVKDEPGREVFVRLCSQDGACWPVAAGGDLRFSS